MFGKKHNKDKNEVAVAIAPATNVEQTVKSYSAPKSFEKDAKEMAKLGWYIKAQTSQLQPGTAILFGVQTQTIIVTYERIVVPVANKKKK